MRNIGASILFDCLENAFIFSPIAAATAVLPLKSILTSTDSKTISFMRFYSKKAVSHFKFRISGVFLELFLFYGFVS